MMLQLVRYVLFLNLDTNKVEYRFGTYDEITQQDHQETLEKESHKKVDSIMKKELSEAKMIESESKAVSQIMKQDILNIQHLLVSNAKTLLEQRIPYTIVFNIQPSEQKIKLERLIEAVSTKKKRVKQLATGPSKRQENIVEN